MDLGKPAEIEGSAVAVHAGVAAAEWREGRTAPACSAYAAAHVGYERNGRELNGSGGVAGEAPPPRRQGPAPNRAGVDRWVCGGIQNAPHLDHPSKYKAMCFADVAEWRRVGGGCQGGPGTEGEGGEPR